MSSNVLSHISLLHCSHFTALCRILLVTCRPMDLVQEDHPQVPTWSRLCTCFINCCEKTYWSVLSAPYILILLRLLVPWLRPIFSVSWAWCILLWFVVYSCRCCGCWRWSRVTNGQAIYWQSCGLVWVWVWLLGWKDGWLVDVDSPYSDLKNFLTGEPFFQHCLQHDHDLNFYRVGLRHTYCQLYHWLYALGSSKKVVFKHYWESSQLFFAGRWFPILSVFLYGLKQRQKTFKATW